MKMKYLSFAVISGLALSSFAKDDFVVIVDKENSNYEVGVFFDNVETTEWAFDSETNCSLNYDNNDIYKDIPFNQIETCDNIEKRTITTTRTYENGTEEIISIVNETQTIIDVSKEPVSAIGSHLESTCKNVLNFNNDLPTGVYTILVNSNETQAYCEMDTAGGGWTAAWKNYGGPGATGISTERLMASSTSSNVFPNNVEGTLLSSSKNIPIYDFYKNKTNMEVLKIGRAYNRTTGIEEAPFVSDHNIMIPTIAHFDLGANVSFNTIISAQSSITLNNKVHLTLNGADYGQTNKIYQQGSTNTSLGFANAENGDGHGLPSDNLMNGWGARHIIYYTNENGPNAVRCQPKCWISNSESYNIETVWYYREN